MNRFPTCNPAHKLKDLVLPRKKNIYIFQEVISIFFFCGKFMRLSSALVCLHGNRIHTEQNSDHFSLDLNHAVSKITPSAQSWSAMSQGGRRAIKAKLQKKKSPESNSVAKYGACVSAKEKVDIRLAVSLFFLS